MHYRGHDLINVILLLLREPENVERVLKTAAWSADCPRWAPPCWQLGCTHLGAFRFRLLLAALLAELHFAKVHDGSGDLVDVQLLLLREVEDVEGLLRSDNAARGTGPPVTVRAPAGGKMPKWRLDVPRYAEIMREAARVEADICCVEIERLWPVMIGFVTNIRVVAGNAKKRLRTKKTPEKINSG